MDFEYDIPDRTSRGHVWIYAGVPWPEMLCTCGKLRYGDRWAWLEIRGNADPALSPVVGWLLLTLTLVALVLAGAV